jgi:2-polyprenyl-3-methyl-5-hydroxy-6-metoxy-1,4-benzoquinol methylase
MIASTILIISISCSNRDHMQYEPIKRSLGRFFTKSAFLRKLLYFLLDLLLLRTWHVKRTLKKTAKLLPEDATVLDAGAGFGQYTWRMSSMNRGWRIKAIDINQEQVDDCNYFFKKTSRSERVHYETGDLTALNEENIYDFIITVDVMEHIEKDVLVFNNFFKALKNNGLLLVSTPSDKGGSDVHHEEENSFIDEHVRDGYSIEDISTKLKSAGFRKVDAQYTYGRAGSLSWSLSMKYPVRMLNRSYLFFIILPFYYLIFFPISFFLNIIDLNFRHKSGTGLLVIARK